MKTNQRKVYNPNNFNAVDSAVAFILILAAFYFIELGLTAVIKSFGSIENIDYYLLSIISAFITQGVVLALAVIFSVVRKTPIFSGAGFTFEKNYVDILFGVLLALGLLFLLSGTHYTFVDDVYMSAYGLTYEEYTALIGEQLSGNEFLAVIYAFVLVPVLPCICEEALFRGVIMKGLNQFGSFAAIILSSVFFCLMHGNFSQVIIQFFVGFAIATIVTITDNFAVGCAMHFANNFFSTLVTVSNSVWAVFAPGIDYLLDALQIVCGIVFLIVGGVYFTKRGLAKYKRVVKNEIQKPTGKDMRKPALIAKSNDFGVKNIDFQYTLRTALPADLYDSGYYFYLDKPIRINKSANKVVSIVLLTLGVILASISLFLSL